MTMYVMTIMAQPSPAHEALLDTSPETSTRWDEIHRSLYLSVMHLMMFFSMVRFASSLCCLWVCWPDFQQKPFSPAHVAFVLPVLSHTNAVQAYRNGCHLLFLGGHTLYAHSHQLLGCLLGWRETLNFMLSFQHAAWIP